MLRTAPHAHATPARSIRVTPSTRAIRQPRTASSARPSMPRRAYSTGANGASTLVEEISPKCVFTSLAPSPLTAIQAPIHRVQGAERQEGGHHHQQAPRGEALPQDSASQRLAHVRQGRPWSCEGPPHPRRLVLRKEVRSSRHRPRDRRYAPIDRSRIQSTDSPSQRQCPVWLVECSVTFARSVACPTTVRLSSSMQNAR